MHKIRKRNFQEELEDLRELFNSRSDLDAVLEQLHLDEDQVMIFKRAAIQIKRPIPNKLVISKAYDILTAKSFHNTKMNSQDSQNINAEADEKEVFPIKKMLDKLLPYMIVVIFIWIVFAKPWENEPKITQNSDGSTSTFSTEEIRNSNGTLSTILTEIRKNSDGTVDTIKNEKIYHPDGSVEVVSKKESSDVIDDEGNVKWSNAIDISKKYVDKANESTKMINELSADLYKKRQERLEKNKSE